MIFKRLGDKVLSLQLSLFHHIKYSKQGTFNALPETVFNVIKNTQDYSEFIPWCARSSIKKSLSNNENFTELTITFQKVKQLSYLSHVQILGQNNPEERYKIQSVCKQEPLKSLISIWEIEKNSIIEGKKQQTMVYYSIEYEFASPLLQLTSHLFLNYVGEAMWVIFKEESEKRQLQLDAVRNKFAGNQQNHLSFGKSNKLEYQNAFGSKGSIKQSQDIRIVTNLAQYLAKNPKIHQIYCRNTELKKKLDKWSQMIYGTKNFEEKLQFKIKNYLIHKY